MLNTEPKSNILNEEELEKHLKLAHEGVEASFNHIISSNTGLVVSVAKRFFNRGVEMDDLMQIGFIGLCKAIQRYDFSHNVKFSTYAVSLIIGELKRYFRDHGSMVKVSRNLKELAGKIAVTTEAFKKKGYPQPTVSELSQELGVDAQEIAAAMAAVERPVYFSDMSYNKEGEERTRDTLDLSEDFNEDKVIFNIQLKKALEMLNERDKKILIERYILDKTQKEIAEAIGVSQVHISRLEKKALITLREKM